MKTKKKGILTLFLVFVVHLTFAQEKMISGTVTDQDGLPLPGVNIIVIGSSIGTQTDFDGNYSIQSKAGETLLFSYVGQKDSKKIVGSGTTINIQMTEDAQALEEVVVTGLGIKREKKALGFSQQSVGGEALTQARETDIANALAGKVSGVQIVGNNSSTFGASAIRLRGNDDLLYVVDGVRIYSPNDINNDNVANISVLKGASATAIYGPEGRNGVVIITSKSGKTGKAEFSITHSIQVNSVSSLAEYQNEYGGGYSQTFNTFNYDPTQDPADWASFDGQLYPDYNADESWGPKLDGQLVRHWDSWIEGTPQFGELRAWSPSTNDIDTFYKDAITNNTTFGFSKADEDYNINSTISYVDQNGIIPNSSNKTVKIGINGSYNVSEKLKFLMSINLEDREMLNNPTQGYGNLGSNFNQWWQRQLDFTRLKDYIRNGQAVSWNIRSPRDTRPLYWDSPYFHAYENLNHFNKNSYFGKVGFAYEFNKKLNVTGEMRKTFHSYLSDDRGTTISLLDPAFYEEWHYRNERTDFFGMVNYNDRFLGDNLDVALSIGAEKVEKSFRELYASTEGDLTIPGFYNLAGSEDAVTATTDYSSGTENVETNGLFAKASFGYKSTLYLDTSYRFDWSSTAQAEDNRLETYGASLSLLVNKLIPQNDILTFAKLRTGYASAPFFPDPYLVGNTYTTGDLYQGFGTLSVNSNQENPNLVGGKRGEFEVGTELQFFNNKLAIDLTYFNRVDTDLPVEIDLDGSTGYATTTVNSGKQTSKGIEISLTGDVITSENFNWQLGVNFATLSRYVDEIYEGIDARDLSTYTSNMRLQERVGEEWGLFYGTGFATDENGAILFTENDGNYAYSIEQNKFLGSLLPDFTGGITSTFSYKNVDLFLGFDFQKGGQYYSRTERYMDHSGLSTYTAGLNDIGNPLRDPISSGGGAHIVGVLQTGIDDSGSPISDGTIIDTYVDPQDLYNLGNLGNIYENNVHDASYIKLRTVNLNYRFNKNIVSNLGLTSASLGLFANNVWLISSDLPWIDPSELEKRNGYNWAEAGTLPMTRSIGLNLNVKF